MALGQLVKQGIVLDGAMSFGLEAQGVDTNSALWTAKALLNQPDAVQKVHRDYYEAGAQLAITDTYQANVPAFEAQGVSEEDARRCIRRAVELAQAARDDYAAAGGQAGYVAGSVGPYGAYLADGSEYRGDYQLSSAEFQNFHQPRLTELLAAKPDCLALETQPKLTEVVAVLDWLTNHASEVPVYVSFTLRDGRTISDGTPLAEAAAEAAQSPQVLAVGVNCVDPSLVTPALHTMQEAVDKPFVVYPNRGASYDPAVKKWVEPKEPVDFPSLTKEWYQEGARLIGGCCTTGPNEIRQIATAMAEVQAK